MAKNFETFGIDCSRGGLNHNPNIDAIQPYMMVWPTRNLNLHEGGRQPRGGTAKEVDTGYGGARIMGQFDYILDNGTQFLVTVTDDGKIWKDSSNTIKTGIGVDLKPSFAVMNNLLYIALGTADFPQTWDGSAGSTSNLSNPHTEWAAAGYPIQFIVHGREASERLWAIGGHPRRVYASALSDGASEADYTTGNVDFYVGRGTQPLVGGIEFGDRLLIFNKREFYQLNDDDFTASNWFFTSTQWTGGVGNFRLAVKTSNDLVCFTDDGDIYSIRTVQAYGDYKYASLARPAFIHTWIKEFARLSYINDFHAVYNPVLRAIDFFIVPNGQTTVQRSLRYFEDRPPEEAWMVMDNQSFDSGYDASCSTLVEVGVGDFQIYTGDYSGNTWKLEQATKSDDGNGYYAGYKTPNAGYGNVRATKRYRKGWIITKPSGVFSLNVNIWVDGQVKTSKSVSVTGSGDVFGTGLFGTAVFGGDEILDDDYSMGHVGKRIQKEIYRTTAGTDFLISSDLTDFKWRGRLQDG